MNKHPVLAFIRTTLVGGVVFLVPILLIAVILNHGIKLAVKLSTPAMKLLPDALGGGVVAADIAAGIVLLLLAFGAGMFARTGIGQRILQWLENSLIGSLPQFNFVRGIAESVDGDENASGVELVLVPTDAGLCLGFIFAPSEGHWTTVFVPGAPDWKSGSVVYVEPDNIRKTDISFAHAIKLLRKLGNGSEKVIASLPAT